MFPGLGTGQASPTDTSCYSQHSSVCYVPTRVWVRARICNCLLVVALLIFLVLLTVVMVIRKDLITGIDYDVGSDHPLAD